MSRVIVDAPALEIGGRMVELTAVLFDTATYGVGTAAGGAAGDGADGVAKPAAGGGATGLATAGVVGTAGARVVAHGVVRVTLGCSQAEQGTVVTVKLAGTWPDGRGLPGVGQGSVTV